MNPAPFEDKFAKPSGDSLKNLPPVSLRSLMPTRIRTILIINVVLAVGFTVAQAIVKNPTALQIIVPMILIWMLLIVPLMIVENYLYSKKRGWWYSVRHGLDHSAASNEPRADRGPYKRTSPTDGEVPEESLDRASGLFGTTDGSGRVSRASLLKSVAKQLEADGKSQAASRCHDLIDERYGHEASKSRTDDSR